MELMEQWRKLLLNSSHPEMMSGNPLEFMSIGKQTLQDCSIAFRFTQNGSGTPSYSEPRPIIGFDKLQVVAGGVEHEYPLDRTFYGGTYDLSTGLLTETYMSIVFNGDYPIDGFYRQSDGVIKITVPYPFAQYWGGSAIPEIWSTNARTISQSATWKPVTSKDFVAIGTNTSASSTTLYIGRTEWKNKTMAEISALAAKKPTTIVYKTSTPQIWNYTPDIITIDGGPCRIETTPGASFSGRVWTQPQDKYCGIPVLIDNAKFDLNGGTINDIVEDPDWFIAGWFDTGNTGLKKYVYYRHGYVEGGARTFNDINGTSVGKWPVGFQSDPPINFGSEVSGRYVAVSVYKPTVDKAYVRRDIDYIYLFKGKNSES